MDPSVPVAWIDLFVAKRVRPRMWAAKICFQELYFRQAAVSCWEDGPIWIHGGVAVAMRSFLFPPPFFLPSGVFNLEGFTGWRVQV